MHFSSVLCVYDSVWILQHNKFVLLIGRFFFFFFGVKVTGSFQLGQYTLIIDMSINVFMVYATWYDHQLVYMHSYTLISYKPSYLKSNYCRDASYQSCYLSRQTLYALWLVYWTLECVDPLPFLRTKLIANNIISTRQNRTKMYLHK